jgi:hypothetical protein
VRQRFGPSKPANPFSRTYPGPAEIGAGHIADISCSVELIDKRKTRKVLKFLRVAIRKSIYSAASGVEVELKLFLVFQTTIQTK